MGSGSSINIAKGVLSNQLEMCQLISEIIAMENEARVAEELSGALSDGGYTITESLRNHIESAEPVTSGRTGIKGAHNKRKFLRISNDIGAQIIDIVPNSQLMGVEEISYRMPKKDARGNLTGEYQSRLWKKTVYDPAIISTSDYLKWGLEAANNVAKNSVDGKLGREWSGVDNQGVHW